MKKAKRLLSILMCVIMLFSITPAFADEVPETVEIRFCVGDETLTINGNSVTVEKPYVVGDGVTLVPLRVITEAFGAKVGWEQSTKTATLEYPGINMSLQIGNSVAEVNGQAVKLLAPPELKPGVTMVPLRFISETFGATVSYDNATRQITVVKQTSQSGEGSLKGAVTAEQIGDSYYKWSMKNPVDMYMEYRAFDGMYTLFAYDDYNYLTVEVELLDPEYDFNSDFAEGKTSLKDYTLVRADKNTTPDGQKSMHLQAKDKVEFADIRRIVDGDYLYTICGLFENEKEDIKKQGMETIESFMCFFEGGKTHDLSEVKEGKREFVSDDIGFSIKVPADFYLASNEDSENEFTFIQNKIAGFTPYINVSIYSKDNTGSAEALAREDCEHNRKVLNEKISKFTSGVVSKNYNNLSVYEYVYEVDGYKEKSVTKDMFFEVGQYVYNVAVCFENTDDVNKRINDVINSIKAEPIDFDKMGIFLRNQFEEEGAYKVEVQDGYMMVPDAYEHTEIGNATVFINRISGVSFTYQYVSTKGRADKEYAREEIGEIERSLLDDPDTDEIITRAKAVTYGGRTFAYVGISTTTDYEKTYAYTYLTTNAGNMYAITVAFPEKTYSENSRKEINKILESLKFD